MEAAIISEQGLCPHMEDTYFLDLNFGGQGWVFGGIYDGHNGNYASNYAAQKLHSVFLSGINSSLSPQQAFINSYEQISDELKTRARVLPR